MIYLLVARVHHNYIGVVGRLLVLCSEKGCFSNKDGVSLRLCNVEELVLSGPCFADVNVETVTHIPSKSGSFINGYLDFFVVLQSRSS